MTPKQKQALLDERAALRSRLDEIAAELNADHVARASKRKPRPVKPPRDPQADPRVAVIRAYAREHLPGAVVYNNLRKDHRTVKIARRLTQARRTAHEAAIRQLVPTATFKTAKPPYGPHDPDKLSLVVVLR